jgi:hypothetical protein
VGVQHPAKPATMRVSNLHLRSHPQLLSDWGLLGDGRIRAEVQLDRDLEKNNSDTGCTEISCTYMLLEHLVKHKEKGTVGRDDN